jgi:glyoxylase-like metal-dependent hydrolase (beta-lactamase superfamily II)
VLGPFETNCYVVRPEPSQPGDPCWIVDAGFDPAGLIALVRDRGLRPELLILTHGHGDHIAGVREVRGTWPSIPLLIHEAERDWPGDPDLNLSAAIGIPVAAPAPDRLLRDGDELQLAGSHWRVLHTPGHSPGGITLYSEADGVALVGDALFAGSVGRTDFPGSDPRTLARSIREKLYTLPDETIAYPGHGPETTIGHEKSTNPFVRG